MMLKLAAATIRQRWVSLSGAFLAVAGGVAVVVPMLLVLTAAMSAHAPGPQRFAAAPAVVVPSGTLTLPYEGTTVTVSSGGAKSLPAALVSRLKASGRTTADRTFPVQTDTGLGTAAQVGHGWSSAAPGRYRLTAGHAPGPGQVVIASAPRAELGQVIAVKTPAGSHPYVVSGFVAPQSFENAVFFDDADAARLDPAVDAVAAYEPLAAVRQAVGDQGSVLTGAARAQADPDPSEGGQLIVGLLSAAGTAAAIVSFVAACVVLGTFAFVGQLRRRELALLRLAGLTTRQLRWLVVTEASVVGVVGSLAGCAIGLSWGRLAGRVLVHAGVAPAWFSVTGSWWPLPAGLVVGVGCALAGSSLPAWQAGRAGPVAALREAGGGTAVLTRMRWLAALVALGSAVAVAGYTTATAPLEMTSLRKVIEIPLLLVAGVALLLPAPLAAAVRPLTKPLRRLGGSIEVVTANLAYAGQRTAATAGIVVIAAGVAGTSYAMAGNASRAAAFQAATTDRADYSVTAADGAATVPPAAVTALRAMPGTRVFPIGATAVNVGTRAGEWIDALNAELLPPAALGATVDPAVLSGTLRGFGPGSLVIDQHTAQLDGLTVGARLLTWGPDGTRRDVTVTAIVRASLAGVDAYVSGTAPPAARLDVITPAKGATIKAAVAGLPVTVRSGGPPGRAADQASVLLVVGLALAYSVIAVANVMAIASAGRRSELLALRLAGATRSRVLGLVAAESAICAAIGTVAAAAAALVVIVIQRVALAGAAGGFPPYLPWLPLGTVAAASAAIGVLAAVTTAARAMRDPAAALAGDPG